ncbi:MAG: methylenetetrahydrofolate reductase C-terminal domain-containing protein [Syntrophorhabdaceae bacterium]|nr:methylenetetrahydrofolate reductase C-terminal domain-containing protein [Syntrophorhabdaceae bacterium]
MIIANRKPFEEIVDMLKPYKRILLLGCNECVTVCAVGGAKEVAVLSSELAMYRAKEGQPIDIKEHVLERNCDPEYVEALIQVIGDREVILSMACGCGIQFVGERYRNIPVLPGVNTTFYGVTEEHGVWTERCQGCGNCILDKTMGICPVSRCAKSLFNGPCGGSQGGNCEVNKDTPCAWQLIVDRYKERNMLHRYLELQPIKDWSTSRDGGPRKRVREDLKI